MRRVLLSKAGVNKLRQHQSELRQSDVEDSIKSLPPGEWCVLYSKSSEQKWVAFVNPLVPDNSSPIHVLDLFDETNSWNSDPSQY